MRCGTCKFWQGHRNQTSRADCYRIIGDLCPELDEAVQNVYDDSGNVLYQKKFPIPFDPHLEKEWRHVEIVVEAMKKLRREPLPFGVYKDFSNHLYIQTHPWYKGCKFYKKRG